MNTIARARQGPLRATVLLLAAAIGGAAMLLAGCGHGSSAASASSAPGGSAAAGSGAGGAAPGSLQTAGRPPAEPRAAGAAAGPNPAGQIAVRAAALIQAQRVIDTASLTVQVSDVAAAASTATQIAAAAGGYVSDQQESVQPGQRAAASASLQLKIPAAAYPAALSKLASSLGTLRSLSRQATDVTQRVADVSSRVTSARAAVAQLRTLLRRAGSVGGLLAVQDQINEQESGLEALLSQQRTLDRQTSYATVSLLLVSHHRRPVHKKNREHGFATGLSGGWRALRLAVSWLLTVLGAVLPFAVPLALALGIGYCWRRARRRRSSPPAAA